MNLPLPLQFLRPGWWGIHVLAVTLVAGAGFAAGAHHQGSGSGHAGHAGPAPTPHAEGENPVQSEMRLLVEALSTAPASFAAGDLRFFDREFHAVLEELAEHSAKNEIAPAARAYGQVLAACNGCHSEFAAPR